MSDLYARADQAIKTMNRANLKAFGKLKLAKWDELNVVREVAEVYDDSVERAKREYLAVARDAFETAARETKKKPDADDFITMLWVMEMLEEVDPVTLYAFLPETERKKQRLVEALAVAHNKNQEVDRALRYWTQQVGQYADNSVFYARLDAFRAADVKLVRWVSQKDERVCEDCEELDDRVFPIDEVPPPPHWGCRCHLVPV